MISYHLNTLHKKGRVKDLAFFISNLIIKPSKRLPMPRLHKTLEVLHKSWY